MDRIPTALELFRLAQAMRSAAGTVTNRALEEEMRVAAVQLQGFAAAWPIPRDAAHRYAEAWKLLRGADATAVDER